MVKIKLSKPSPAVIDAVERERYEILREITRMMFQDNIGAQGVVMLGQVADMIRRRDAEAVR